MFDARDIPLEGSNLIEASAGTGKTYSIAILVLRLLVEKELPLQEMLMVTFTQAAVAELEQRIRLFVRMAADAAAGHEIADGTIAGIVSAAQDAKGAAPVEALLSRTAELLDDTSVMTIHGFCQQTLHEFAFETGQLFGAETLKDMSPLITDEVNDFWRTTVTGIPAGLLARLLNCGLTRIALSEVLKAHFGGKKYIPDTGQSGDLPLGAFLEEAWIQVASLVKRQRALTEELAGRIGRGEEGLRARTEANRYAKKNFLPLLDRPGEMIEALRKNREKAAYVASVYGPELEVLGHIDALTLEIEAVCRPVVSRLYADLIRRGSARILEFKERRSMLSFDDMILRLHDAVVVRALPSLVEALRQKYKAVFVDEFQDTDRMQYEIFRQLFGEGTLLFYIGDPKQSIYGWRKADIGTYLRAGKEVATRYDMNVNYRSDASYIAAMNLFFAPEPGFDAFAFGGGEAGFSYIPVEAPPASGKGGLFRQQRPEAPLRIHECGSKEKIAAAVCAQVLDLLEDPAWQIPGEAGFRRPRPADFGILVRSNSDGALIRQALSGKGIPSIHIDETRILATEEAAGVQHVLEAMMEPGRGLIHKALLAPFTGIGRQELTRFHPDELQERFRIYGELWDEAGIYAAMLAFIRDFGIRAALLGPQRASGARQLANLMQLIEVLHKTQTASRLNHKELVDWLKKGTEGMTVEGDEFQQRMESDEEAVRIMTIHKSKGLEFPIVVAPFLDMKAESKNEFCSFRDPDTGDYLFGRRDRLTGVQLQALIAQQEQENRRLVYVAITRAVHACFVYRNTHDRVSSLSPFTEALKPLSVDGSPVAFVEATDIPLHEKYSGRQGWRAFQPRQAAHFVLEDPNWRRLSYTFLAKKHPYVPKDDSHETAAGYEHFVFKQLARGTITGNMLHEVLEKIDFTRPASWEAVVASAMRRFLPGAPDSFGPHVLQMLAYIVRIPLVVAGQRFSLSEIPRSSRVSEFEFDFHVGDFTNTWIQALSTAEALVEVGFEEPLSGIMNGKIDLVFEKGGKYYILDWKSNFLGDTLDYYAPEKLRDAMNEHNYHLQYLLYTLALKRYLTVKLPDFDYEKHFGGVIYVFLRGVRGAGAHGLFTARPSLSQMGKITEILDGTPASM